MSSTDAATAPAVAGLTEMPDPQFIMVGDGLRIATYSWGDESDPVAVVVHGFASSTKDNWVATGWVRDLLRSGFRVIGIDQRGHGASDKPHNSSDYDLRQMARDVETVLDTYLVDDAVYVGYSLGARVGWEVLQDIAWLKVSVEGARRDYGVVVDDEGDADLTATDALRAEMRSQRTGEEEDMLDTAHDVRPTSRLSCQITVAEDLDGLRVQTPEKQY